MLKDNRFLNGCYAIEVMNGKLNCSKADMEDNTFSDYKNVTYVKKIGGRGQVSAVCQKFNIQNFLEDCGMERNIKIKDDKKVVFVPDPQKYAIDDVFGFMVASNEEISPEKYESLPKEMQDLYKKDKKVWKRNVTKKRVSRLLMSSLINVSNRKVNREFHTCSTAGDNQLYVNETYSGIMAGLFNFDINKTSQFNVSATTDEFRDYSPEEVNGRDLEIAKEEKLKRITSVLKGIQHLSIKGNQTNYLTDTKVKFVVLGEYSWGNNQFQGLIKSNGVDIEALKEILEEDEDFRVSDIWIGVRNNIMDENYKGLKEKLQEELQDYPFVHIGSVNDAFNGYIEHLTSTLK